MAYNALYENELRKMLTDPGSFQGTPGFQFALDQGLGAINRSNSAQRSSGNVLAQLTKYGTGLAMQDYGNQMGRLGSLQGQAQQYDLGQGQNANQAQSIANQFALGQGQNRNAGQRNWMDFTLGLGQNENTAQRNANDYGVNWLNANANWRNFAGQNQTRQTQAAQDWMRFLT